MGCDIHIYTEVLKKDRWIQADTLVDSSRIISSENSFFFSSEMKIITNPNMPSKTLYLKSLPALDVPWNKQIYLGRNYTLFGILAGVRSYSTPHIFPRGLPQDMSDSLQDIADHYYEHTGHWYTLKELLQIKSTTETQEFFSRKMPNSTINKLKRKAKKYKVPFSKIRVVFWFDS